MEQRSCADCRYHAKQYRRRALGVADGDLELVEFDDEPQVVYICKHPEQIDRDMGKGDGCALFEKGVKSGLSPDLEQLLARRAERAARPTEER